MNAIRTVISRVIHHFRRLLQEPLSAWRTARAFHKSPCLCGLAACVTAGGKTRSVVNADRIRGFSLVELLITTLVMTTVMGSVLVLTNQGQSRKAFQDDVLATQQSLRETSDQIYRDIHMSGYPQQKVFASSTGWTAANSNKVASGFTVINSNGLTFQGDIDDDGIVEVVEYSLSGTTLRRSEVEKNADGTIPTASYQILAENVNSLNFTYYRMNSGTWTTSAVTVSNTTRVDFTLGLQTAIKDPQNRRYSILTIRESVVPRNLE